MHWGMITPMYHSYHIHPLFTSIKDNDKDNETKKTMAKTMKRQDHLEIIIFLLITLILLC